MKVRTRRCAVRLARSPTGSGNVGKERRDNTTSDRSGFLAPFWLITGGVILMALSAASLWVHGGHDALVTPLRGGGVESRNAAAFLEIIVGLVGKEGALIP